MPDYKIFSDGACDISIDDLKKLDVETLPFYVSLNGTDYKKELVELNLDEFYNAVLEDHIFPKTSLPSVHDYINAFTPYIEQGKEIICFTITNTLSGSVQSAETAKIMLCENYPGAKIYIVNSLLATGAQSLLIREAVKMRDAGYSAEDLFKTCEELKKTGKIIFMVGTLEYLEKGGRIGKLASLSGSIFNIKPLIILENGEIRVGGVSRGRKKGIAKLTQLCKEFFEKSGENKDDYFFSIGSSNTPEEIPQFKEDILKTVGEINIVEDFPIGATIASHTGPDTLGMCFIKSYKKL